MYIDECKDEASSARIYYRCDRAEIIITEYFIKVLELLDNVIDISGKQGPFEKFIEKFIERLG